MTHGFTKDSEKDGQATMKPGNPIKIAFKYKPAYQSWPSLLFSKDVNVHYKNLWAGGDAGFEEVISLCIAGPELPDPIRANWETCHFETPWKTAAYGTFLTAFKTLG